MYVTKRFMVMLFFVLLCVPMTQAQTVKDQSFKPPQSWAYNLTYAQGWNGEHPRMLADVNGDGKKDVVGFGNDGVWIGLSNGIDFGTTQFALEDFGYNQGWRVSDHVRTTADVNGDGRQDIVGFGKDGVWVALSTGAGFYPPQLLIEDFGYNQGWRVSDHVRTTADVNGDGKQDIVGFGKDGVWVAFSAGTGFGTPQLLIGNFGYNQGWRVSLHVRTTADVNGDGKQDIVGFGKDGVWVAFSAGTGFGTPQLALKDFGYNQGWRVGRHPRFVADLNADGYQDIVGYGEKAVYRALGGPGGFGSNRMVLRALTAASTYLPPTVTPRFIGDATGDGMPDLVVFDEDKVKVAPSTDQPPPPPPAAPTNLRITAKSETSLTLAWNDNSDGELGFLIFGSIDYQVGPNITSKTFSELESDTEYCFRVFAFNLFGESGADRSVCGRTSRKEEPPPPNNQPFIIVNFEPYFPQYSNGHAKLRITGGWFQPLEQVSLRIITTVQGHNPFVDTIETTADSFGAIDTRYDGSGGGVCWPGQPRTFEVQATGLTSSKKSNVSKTGC